MKRKHSNELHVDPTGVQQFQQRFGKRFRPEEAPPLSHWRCNLTGLSQVHNLYFIAYSSAIYVYVPHFPTQAITAEPVLIFNSQPSSQHLHGTLDHRNPHSINNLVIQFLGTEEVVVVVRDDGDVDAFLVRHIAQAIERRAEPSSDIGVDADEIRPFFQSNVGISAWGLAIHAQARILATSSNAHEVRIFKFGLLQTDDDDGSSGEEDEELPDADGDTKEKEKGRKTDVTHHILNGQSNIPHIAFCNTGDDPEGRWLLTTDISGICRVMDISNLKQVQAFRFGRGFLTPNSGGFDRLNAGWTIMFLDRRSFREEESVHAALGMCKNESLPGIQRNPGVWDLSKTVQRLPERSQPFRSSNLQGRRTTLRRGFHAPPSSADSEEEVAEQEEVGAAAAAVLEQAAVEQEAATDVLRGQISAGEAVSLPGSDSESDGGAPLDIDMEVPEQAQDRESDETPDIRDIESDTQRASQTGEDMPAESGSPLSDPSSPRAYASDSDDIIDDGADPEDEMTEDVISYTSWYNGESICANEPQFIIPTSTLCEDLPCPVLHSSVRNIYLLQPSNQHHTPGPYSRPMIGLANPLRQAITRSFEYLGAFERINMAASIPPLGVVVLASQKGRVLVLSLSKIYPHTLHPAEMQAARQESKTVYTMRVECILPSVSQEKENERSCTPLHGIAVAPVQGCEDGRRWRLMLMYQDHSILSYEISRGARDGVGGAGIVV